MTSPQPLQPGIYYHIFNRGNNRENIFIEKKNYAFFLSLYDRYLTPVVETFAYCLLKNHFHLLIRVRTPEEQPAGPGAILPASQSFSNLFNAYTHAINTAYGRTGSLFEHPFHRIQVRSDWHFDRLITYIHQNPQKHGLIDDFREWPYSSYDLLTSNRPTRLQRGRVLEWFGGVDGFCQAHQYARAAQEIGYLINADEGE